MNQWIKRLTAKPDDLETARENDRADFCKLSTDLHIHSLTRINMHTHPHTLNKINK